MNFIDIFIQNYFSMSRTEDLVEINYLISSVFDLSLYFIFLIVCIGFLIHLVRGFRYAFLFGSSLFVTAVLVYFLKSFFNVSRPADSIAIYFGQSFPSYHASIATVFFVILMYIFDSHFKSFGRIIFNVFCTFSIFLMALSRVYLGAHWVSDVFSGIILGVIISYLAIILFKNVINVHSSTSMLK